LIIKNKIYLALYCSTVRITFSCQSPFLDFSF